MGRPKDQIGDQRQADDQAERHEADRRLLARRGLPTLREDAVAESQDEPDQERDAHDPGAVGKDRPRQDDAARVEKGQAEDGQRLPRRRQRLQDDVVPEDELQQQRDIAEQFDVDGRDPRDDPVLRQA